MAGNPTHNSTLLLSISMYFLFHVSSYYFINEFMKKYMIITFFSSHIFGNWNNHVPGQWIHPRRRLFRCLPRDPPGYDQFPACVSLCTLQSTITLPFQFIFLPSSRQILFADFFSYFQQRMTNDIPLKKFFSLCDEETWPKSTTRKIHDRRPTAGDDVTVRSSVRDPPHSRNYWLGSVKINLFDWFSTADPVDHTLACAQAATVRSYTRR